MPIMKFPTDKIKYTYLINLYYSRGGSMRPIIFQWDRKWSDKKIKSYLNKLMILAVFCIFVMAFSIPASIATNFQNSSSPYQDPDPDIEIELDTYEQEIDTSPEVTEPMVQVEGEVVLQTQHPYVTINLTIDKTTSNWNCSVTPNKFNLSNYPVDQSIQEILITIKAPKETKNGTTERFVLHGTWSYIPESPLPTPDPISDEIEPVFLDITAKNETINGDGISDDGDSKKSEKEEDKGFLPGFEGILLVSIILIMLLIFPRKRIFKD
jgi:hypothetical protein